MYGAAAGLPPTLARFKGSTPIAMNVIPVGQRRITNMAGTGVDTNHGLPLWLVINLKSNIRI
jgi:hypothetical protein